jgi:hypothetical protein
MFVSLSALSLPPLAAVDDNEGTIETIVLQSQPLEMLTLRLVLYNSLLRHKSPKSRPLSAHIVQIPFCH